MLGLGYLEWWRQIDFALLQWRAHHSLYSSLVCDWEGRRTSLYHPHTRCGFYQCTSSIPASTTTGGTCPGNWFHYSFPCSYGVLYRKPRHLSIESVNPVSQSSAVKRDHPGTNANQWGWVETFLIYWVIIRNSFPATLSLVLLFGQVVWSCCFYIIVVWVAKSHGNLMNYSTALYSLIKLVRGSVVEGGRWVCSWWGWGSELAY